MSPNCVVCKKRTKSGQTRKVTVEQHTCYRNKGTHLAIGGVQCNACRQRFYKSRGEATEEDVDQRTENRSTERSEDVITLPICSMGKTHRLCCVCRKSSGKFVVMPETAPLDVFITQGILVPAGVRCCAVHLESKRLKPNSTLDKSLMRKTTSIITSSELVLLLENLRKKASSSQHRRVDFDESDFTDEEMNNLTGLTREQFDIFVSSIVSLKRSPARSVRTALGLLLVKLRTGLSHRLLGTLFGMKSTRSVSKVIQQAKRAVCSDFVPSYLGFHHISRDDILEHHTTYFATQLFSNFISSAIIAILDGTYIYIQKSSKYQFQRRCFSMHKHRPLVKPMVVTSTDGYIISILGPYFADGRNNDASIVQHMMRCNEENMMKWFKKQDILILDRGFRDGLDFLQEAGFNTESPNFLGKAQKQFDTESGNASRLVTKIRWAVESVNARLKTFNYLAKVVCNRDMPNLKEYNNIVAAICNRFRPPLQTIKPEDCAIAAKMLQMSKQPNALQNQILEDKSLKKRSKSWLPLEDNRCTTEFPKLTEEYLRSLTFGVYQLKQAPMYVDQHLAEGNLQVSVHDACADIVCARMQSRHTSSKKYFLWIKYASSEDDPIVDWYCECKAGARTVGCCAHVASILWYLGYARHTNYQAKGDKYSALFKDAAEEVTTDTDLDTE